MRGAAPSIVCPRCGLAAPPADVIGKFTLCTKCGMAFDAAPRERLVSVKRRRASEPEPEPEPAPPDPGSYAARRKRHAMSGKQFVLLVVASFAIAYIKITYFPSREDRARAAEIERMERDAHARAVVDLAELREQLATLVPGAGAACGKLRDLLATLATCKIMESHQALERAFVAVADMVGATTEADCATAYGRILETRPRLDCR